MYRRILALLLGLMLLSGCAAAPSPTEPTETTVDTQIFYEEGYRQGHADGLQEGAGQAYEEGFEDGSEAGSAQAYQEGFADGCASFQSDPTTETVSDEPPRCAAEEAGFVELSQVIPDVILEIRYYSTYNFVGQRIDGYEAPVALLTQEAADALRQVSEELRSQGYRLKIYDAYRPQSAVDHFAAWAEDWEDTQMKPYFYPDVDKENLFEYGYIAHYSGHSRGSTVDLTLFDMETGKEVDMGGTFDFFGPVSHADHTDSLTQEQIQNRQLLRTAMLSHGFRGIDTEWWHFTLNDEPYPDTYFDFPVKG